MAERLTTHQRDRARFVLSFQQRGKLQKADPQIRREMRAFVRDYPREPIVQRIARDLTVGCVRTDTPQAEARPRERRAGRPRSTRAGPGDDSELPRSCEVCGASLAGKRRHATTCSTRWRVARHRSLKPDPELLRRWEAALPRFKRLGPEDRLSLLAAVVWPDDLPALAGRLREAA